ncbi:MAG: hypothetical protein AAF740_04440 [Bacteroidota bacterium]
MSSITTKSIREFIAQGRLDKVVSQTLALAQKTNDSEHHNQAIAASGAFTRNQKAYSQGTISSEENDRNLARLEQRILFILEQLDRDFPNLSLQNEESGQSAPTNTGGRVIHATNYFEKVDKIENLSFDQKKQDKDE